ncbi:MAG: PAS domain-containing sensor histidine kinase [Verrucomicrobia bacterium]|nr:MAG: PAS domain-containing sensor histidine kinase [Verrucomicrobiota bacterium]
MTRNPKSQIRNPKWTHDRRILLLTLLSGLPALAVALALLWRGDFSSKTQWTLTVLVLGAWCSFAFAARERVVHPLQTVSNLLSALREEDFSVRARGARRDDPLGDVMFEVNALSEMLREQRLGALEATALLRTVMEEINLAVFAFDDAQRLRLVNRAGERLLAQPIERLLGRTAGELGLADCLQGEPTRTLHMTFPGSIGRWGMRRSSFRQGGKPHQLLVLADLSQALREEERQAWQRLLRVLGHELNNSLAPIKSIAGSLGSLLGKEPPPVDWKEDMQGGLGVITARADALSRFMEAYSRLARLPQPKLGALEIEPLIRRVAGLETRVPVVLAPGPNLMIQADGDQLEQLLINLLRNAADAALETKGGVKIGWAKTGAQLEIRVEDEGPGLSNTANLFVPFFTTKPGGSGIGLALSRQIAEAHGGSLTLENRKQGTGCLARLRLPLG